jgi:hypothetical protein
MYLIHIGTFGVKASAASVRVVQVCGCSVLWDVGTVLVHHGGVVGRWPLQPRIVGKNLPTTMFTMATAATAKASKLTLTTQPQHRGIINFCEHTKHPVPHRFCDVADGCGGPQQLLNKPCAAVKPPPSANPKN